MANEIEKILKEISVDLKVASISTRWEFCQYG
jgi:hypothetical protein